MTQFAQYIRPLKLNVDKSPKVLGEDESYFLLNHERSVNPDGSKRGTLGKTTPKAANYPACDMQKPAGENYAVGKYKSERTNELYSWVFNSNGVDYIQRINSNGECEVVYHGCLNLSPEPAHTIEGKIRAYMKIDKLCANVHGKQLIWTQGTGPIGQIDVEASIATDFFTTSFFQRCPDPCAYVQMCVPDPCGCLKGEFVPLQSDQAGKKNNILDKAFKFVFRWVYYDGRASIWSEPSTPFFLDTKGCFDSSEGFSRCIKLRVPIGNPLVDKIEIAFLEDGLWKLTEVVEKYKKYNNSQQYWYERELAELPGYSDEDCSFDYFFCNDKLCEPLDTEDINRAFNPMPREPQCLLPIGLTEQDVQALGFINYKQGNCPIDKSEIEKFDIAIDCNTNDCASETVEITVRAVIHNLAHNRNQFIYRTGGGSSNAPDDYTDTAWFGGLNPSLDGGFEIGYDQNFNDKTRNLIFYIEGTPYWAVAKQWKAHKFFTQLEQWGTIGNMDDVHTRNRWRRAIRNGEFFYQEAKIKVPKGTKGFIRMASHHSTTGVNAAQDTSTFVVGIMSDIHLYHGDMNILVLTDLTTEEIFVDACAGTPVEIDKTFVIVDNAVDEGGSKKASAYHGYIVDKNGLPVEGAVLTSGVTPVDKTDHNGFYHFYLSPGEKDGIDIDINVERDCTSDFSNIQTMNVLSSPGNNTRHDQQIEDEDYANNFYANVHLTVKDCSGHGVPGIRVSISGSKYKITGGDGIARLRVRNYNTRDREVTAVVLNNNGCFQVDCSGICHPCMPTSTSTGTPCYKDKPTITLSDARLNIDSVNISKRGLKAGGRYPFALVAKGDCGRISAAYEIKYLDIPRTQEKNKESFCGFSFNGNGITFPSWVNCIEILRGENVNPFELQWIVDKIERTDDGKIKITIQSLNDYNERFLFKTNTVYKWLKGDRVEFIKNGDGKIFPIAFNGLLNYLTLSPFADELISGEQNPPADFFNQLLITDDGKLDSLKEGAVIEIQRSKACETEPAYFSICSTIPVENNKLKYETGTFTTFDTYFVNRIIGNLPVQLFEHHSPSDFWGERLSDAGRPYFVNKYENEKRYGRNITINAPNQYNFFGHLIKVLNPISHGDIIAAHLTDDKIGLCISEHDNSLFEVGDDFLKVGSDGIVRALSGDQVISDTQPKVSGSYGCQYDYIGSIFFGDGWATWWDLNKGHYIKHNYNEAIPIDENKMHTWFSTKSQEILASNQQATDALNKYRVVTGQDHQTGALHITVKRLRDNGVNNTYRTFGKFKHETLLFDPKTDDFLTFASYIPEAYGHIDLFDGAGCAFVAFLNGVPYIHPVISQKWLEFFGVACDWVVGVSFNKGKEKEKRYVGMEVQSELMWFAKQVVTDKPNFTSEIPAVRWKKQLNKWNASFLRNINSRGGLYNGNEAVGYYCQVTLVRDNTDGLKYNSVDNNKRIVFSELDIIAAKSSIVEQTGFTSNL